MGLPVSKSPLLGAFLLSVGAFGLLPFLNPVRAFPSPDFWMEWLSFVSACTVALFAVMSNPAQLPFGSGGPLRWSVLMVALGVTISVVTGRVGSVEFTMFAIASLLLGLVLHCVGYWCAGRLGEVGSAQVLAAWSWGVVAALVLNGMAVAMSRHGFEWVLYRIFPSEMPVRAGGMFGQPNMLGVFSDLALCNVIYLVSQKKINLFVAFTLSLLVSVLVAMSGSRAALLVWVSLFLMSTYATVRRRAAGEALVCIGGALAFMFVQIAWAEFAKTGGATAGEMVAIARTSTLNERYEQWRDVLSLIAAHPFLGVGYGRFACSRFFELDQPMIEPNSEYTHNLFSELLVDFGILGLLAAGLVFWYLLRLMLRFVQVDYMFSGKTLVVSWVVSLVVYAQFEHPFGYLFFLLPFLFVSGFSGDFGAGVVKAKVGRTLVSGFVLMMLVGAIWVGDGYWRIQGGLLGVSSAVRGGRPDLITDLMVANVRVNSIFMDYIDQIWVDVTSSNDGFESLKYPVVRRLFCRLPSKAGVYQVVVYGVGVGDFATPVQVLNRIRTATPAYYGVVRPELDERALTDPGIHQFLLDFDAGSFAARNK